jgi:hypothetical protein
MICDSPPCTQVGPFRYCPIKGCGWTEPTPCEVSVASRDSTGLESEVGQLGAVIARVPAERYTKELTNPRVVSGEIALAVTAPLDEMVEIVRAFRD